MTTICPSDDSIIGADLALNHGAIVRADGFILHTYDTGKGLASSIEELYQSAMQISSYIPLGSNVAVDWDRNISAFGGVSKTGTLMTVLIVYFTAILRLQNHCQCTLVAPSQVRKMLKLPLTCKKEIVHAKVTFPPVIAGFKSKKKTVSLPLRACTPKELKGDVKDAYILARYLRRTLADGR